MRKLLIVAMMLFVFCAVVAAQNSPKVEIFGGYSYFRFGINNPGFNFNGWDASATGYLTKHFGLTGDFAGDYGSYVESDGVTANVSVKHHTYMFGPTFAMPSGKLTLFAHALFGGAHYSESFLSLNHSINGFAMAYGGGVDVNANKKIAIRLGQFDYVYTRFGDANLNHLRYAGGIVFKF